MRLGVAALPMLDRRAQRGQLHAPGHRVPGQQVARLQERLAAALEGAERALRRRQRHAQVHLALVVGRRQQPERRLEPARRRGSGARPAASAPASIEDGDRLLVALARGLLHVVCALARGGSARRRARRPRGRGPRASTPRAWTRTPRAAPAGGGTRSGAAPGSGARGPRRAGRRARPAPRPAGARRSPPPRPARTARRPRPRRPAARAPAGTGTRAPRTARRPPPPARPPRCRRSSRRGERLALLARARELLEVEGVAAAVAVDVRERTRIHVAEQLRRLRLAQLLQADPQERGHRERGGQALRSLAAAEREGDQHGRLRPAPQQRREQLDRGGVGPVEVVQHEHERVRIGQPLEQRPHGAVGPVALVRQRRIGLPARLPQAGQHAGQLVEQLGAPAVLGVGLLSGHVGVEGVCPDAERHVALELGGRAGQHQVAARPPRARAARRAAGSCRCRARLRRSPTPATPPRGCRAPPRADRALSGAQRSFLRLEPKRTSDPTPTQGI